jgi:Asp/Glu/hydantoin racemase
MRLLVVNPNTSEGATRNIDRAVQACAHEGDRFVTVPAASGPELIVTPEDAVAAERGVLAAVAAHDAEVDGIVLASFGDTGADAVRAMRPGLPVIGLAGASLAVARALGGAFSIVSFSERMAPSIRAIVARHGMADALRRLALLPHDARVDPGTVQDSHGARLAALCRDCAAEEVRSVLLAGGPLAGLAGRLDLPRSVPVIDGPEAAVALLRAAIRERGDSRQALPRGPGPDQATFHESPPSPLCRSSS